VDALLPDEGAFAFGDAPTLADVLIVPQLGNARRFAWRLRWPRIAAAEAAMRRAAGVLERPAGEPAERR
jgi:maleylpyruvate isomerase